MRTSKNLPSEYDIHRRGLGLTSIIGLSLERLHAVDYKLRHPFTRRSKHD